MGLGPHCSPLLLFYLFRESNFAPRLCWTTLFKKEIVLNFAATSNVAIWGIFIYSEFMALIRKTQKNGQVYFLDCLQDKFVGFYINLGRTLPLHVFWHPNILTCQLLWVPYRQNLAPRCRKKDSFSSLGFGIQHERKNQKKNIISLLYILKIFQFYLSQLEDNIPIILGTYYPIENN